MTRVALISNMRKTLVTEALETFRPWLADRAEIVFETAACIEDQDHDLKGAEFAIILGGDGTMIAQARQMVDQGIPVIGINFGKIGFITEFSLEEFKANWENIAAGQYETSERVMLKARICDHADEATCFETLAMNDFAIAAGEPFRMLDLKLTVNPEIWGEVGTRFHGDGVIIATPTGSTAYNLSAGGPIISPDVDAFTVTPICPYSLSFRPIVVNNSDTVQINVVGANPGTTLVIDGQHSRILPEGAKLTINTHPTKFKLVQNPSSNYWKMLAQKMRWAERPQNQSSNNKAE